jgi:hypothetical protein
MTVAATTALIDPSSPDVTMTDTDSAIHGNGASPLSSW